MSLCPPQIRLPGGRGCSFLAAPLSPSTVTGPVEALSVPEDGRNELDCHIVQLFECFM